MQYKVICRNTFIYIENGLEIFYTLKKCLKEQRVEYYCEIRWIKNKAKEGSIHSTAKVDM